MHEDYGCKSGGKDQSGFREADSDNMLIKVRKQAEPSVLYSGTEIFFQITIENVSNVVLEKVVFKDVLDSTIPFVLGSVMINNHPAVLADPNYGIVLGTLAVGASIEVSFRALAQLGSPLVASNAIVSYIQGTDRNKVCTARSNTFYFRRFKNNFSDSSAGLIEAIVSSQASLAQMMHSQCDAVQPAMAEATTQQAEKISITGRQMTNAMCRLAKLMENKITFAKYHLTGYNNRVD